MNKILLVISATLTLGFTPLANAILIDTGLTINLTLVEETAPGIQQSEQGPCVIGDPSCSANDTADISFTLLPNVNPSNVPNEYLDIFSPLYSVAAVRANSGDIFSIGIDINESRGASVNPHQLLAFIAEIDGIQTFAYQGPEDLPAVNTPGNGFSDWRLDGFDLTGIAGTSTIRFGLDVINVSAGGDQFFLVAGPTSTVPEPGSLALFGMGIVGFGLATSRRRIRSL